MCLLKADHKIFWFTISYSLLFSFSDLKKHFENQPLSTHVEIEGQISLQCLPPEGVPPPEIIWLKNGEVIDTAKDSNFIISNEGNLLISVVRLADMGNYTCVARNPAGSRYSETASLTVYGKPLTHCNKSNYIVISSTELFGK